MTILETLIVYAFSATNLCRVAAYLPQILLLVRDRGPAQATSGLTWSLFLVSNSATALYSGVVVRDAGMALLFAANALCCAAIVTLVLRRRQQWRGAMRRAAC